ncbi:MAG: acyl-protein synthetase [Candidatus Margulisiibacteriota bacterium]
MTFSFDQDPFGLKSEKKQPFLLNALSHLIQLHQQNCLSYQRISTVYDHFNASPATIAEVPYLPVSLFKQHLLKSIPDSAIVRILESSGTTGTSSKIFLDKETSLSQVKALTSIVQSYTGKQRLPMIIVDSKSVFSQKKFSARAAGISGFSNFGHHHFFLLTEDMQVDKNGLIEFLKEHPNQPLLIFGFTFMIWQYLYLGLETKVDLSKAILFHSGGWKKLIELAVSNDTFKEKLKYKFGLENCINFYGMAEQVGSIFTECSHGYLHAPIFADVLVRHPQTLAVQPNGESGLLETLSVLPTSYPGHAILTEDIGVKYGVDSCPCGRMGTYFHVQGRLPKAEVRGCSDTFINGNTP